jgi:uncharacterized protein YgbK (DUF1537 family)
VGLVSLRLVRRGADAVRAELDTLRARGVRYAVTDAVDDADLITIARATQSLRLLTGAAGLARAVGMVSGNRSGADEKTTLPDGPGIVLAGSCSATTLAQVALARTTLPSYRLDPAEPEEALRWLRAHADGRAVMVYSSARPEERGGRDAAEVFEQTLASVATAAVDLGYRRIVVAGGETAGAVVNALGVHSVEIAAEEDRGVPWCLSTGEPRLALLLKSGNFGRQDLLVRAVTA